MVAGWKLSPEEKVLALDILKDEPALQAEKPGRVCVYIEGIS